MFYSDRLKRLRKEKGLSQLQMSELLDILQSSYSKYENNISSLNLPLLQKNYEEFGVDPKEFFVTPNHSKHYMIAKTKSNEGGGGGKNLMQSCYLKLEL